MSKIEIGIYAFTSKVNGFCYVGQSVNLAKRKREHLKDLRNGNHHATYLQRHCKVHGIDCLDYKILEICQPELLTEKEQFWMMQFEPVGLFNSIPASESAKGFSPTEETRKKLSAAGKGKKRSPETRALMRVTNSRPVSRDAVAKMIATRKANAALKPPKKRVLSVEAREKLIARNKATARDPAKLEKISATSKGRVFSPESLEKMRIAATGRKLTDEAKEKISAANKGLKRSADVRARMSEQRKGRKPIPKPITDVSRN